MKKYISCLIGLILSACFSITALADGKELSREQLALRTEIKTFLSEEGFSPEIDSDGDIKIKMGDYSCYVRVSDVDTNPMYVTIYMPFSNPESYPDNAVLLASKELNRYKGVKVICWDDSYRISAEMFLRDCELFKESFYKVRSQMLSVVEDVLDECDNASKGGGVSGSVSEIPFIITKIEVANIEKDGSIIQDYGSSIWDFKTKYLSPRITIKPLKTSGTHTLYVKLYKGSSLRGSKTESAGYTYSYSDTVTLSGSGIQTFVLTGWGNDTSGYWGQDTYRFEIWYGDYCIGSKTFKVI